VIFRKPYAKEELRKLGLNERQIKAVEYVIKHGSITNKEYQQINKVAKRTASRDLRELVEKGVFKAIGVSKRNLKYIFLGQRGPKMAQKIRGAGL
jgi:ATP-dependent DNA helicase RecG